MYKREPKPQMSKLPQPPKPKMASQKARTTKAHTPQGSHESQKARKLQEARKPRLSTHAGARTTQGSTYLAKRTLSKDGRSTVLLGSSPAAYPSASQLACLPAYLLLAYMLIPPAAACLSASCLPTYASLLPTYLPMPACLPTYLCLPAFLHLPA